MNFLNQIKKEKQKEVSFLEKRVPLERLKFLAHGRRRRKIRSFRKSLRAKPIALIAEIKLKSPSEGSLTSRGFMELAKLYARSKADAVSVLTDKKHFSGSLDYISMASRICPQPILRKDFIIDEYQVYESFLAGADAILLIAAILESEKLKRLIGLSRKLKMDCLVEAHSAAELRKALRSGAEIIGINNRNLKTLKVDTAAAESLIRLVPDGKITVSESGIAGGEDARRIKAWGVNAILAGSVIVKSKNPVAKIKELKLGK